MQAEQHIGMTLTVRTPAKSLLQHRIAQVPPLQLGAEAVHTGTCCAAVALALTCGRLCAASLCAQRAKERHSTRLQ